MRYGDLHLSRQRKSSDDIALRVALILFLCVQVWPAAAG